MIDIVKRLDRLANAEIIPLTTAWEIAKSASKEITRLREENKMAFEAVGDVVKANDDLREKNEKLRIEVMSDYNEGWEEGLSAMKAENEKLREENEKMKYFLRHNVFAEKQFGVYFVCGEGGEKDQNGIPEQIHVCPAYGSDIIYRYKRMDSSAPQW